MKLVPNFVGEFLGNYEIHFGAYEDCAVIPAGNDGKEVLSTGLCC